MLSSRLDYSAARHWGRKAPQLEGEFRRHVVNRARWLVDGAEEPRAESMPYQNKMSHLFNREH